MLDQLTIFCDCLKIFFDELINSNTESDEIIFSPKTPVKYIRIFDYQ